MIRRVPAGQVSTYGRVAESAGFPGYARQVGYALAALGDNTDVPWHRVVNAKGMVSPRNDTGAGWEGLQRTLLEAEGIVFDVHGRVRCQ